MSGRNKSSLKLVAEDRYGSEKKKKRIRHQKRQKQRPITEPTVERGNIVTHAIGWIIRTFFTLIWRVFWRGALIVSVMIAIGIAYFYLELPKAQALLDGRARGSVTLLDLKGDVFAWRGDQFGGAIDAKSVSQDLHNAIIATEDRRFYRHFGISPRGIASAVRINLIEGRGPLSGHGGSTITQQSAKLLCLGVPFDPRKWKSERAYEGNCREGSIWRKVKEAIYSISMEMRYSKEEILTIYLNRAFLGAGARGFEAAAQRYFGKSASDVSIAESAMLAGLLVAPSRYAPTNNLSRSQDRAQLIIGLMEGQNFLSAEEANYARANPAVLSAAAQAKSGGYFADWVMQSGPSFFTQNTTEDVIIKTTLDQSIQNAAEDSLNFIFENQVRQGSKAQVAIVVMSADGAVRAMVGGRKSIVSGAFNRASQALRQTGSAFKPFVYASALNMGYKPYDLIDDRPLTLNIPGSGPWSPKNYNSKFKGSVTLVDAFKDSLNIPAVRLSEAVGSDTVRKVATGFGLSTDLAKGPAIALGASESTLIEMTGAYAGILNGGSSVTPYGLQELRLLGEDTPVMGAGGGIGERVIQEEAAMQLMFLMQQVVLSGTGRRATIPDWEVAGKTGTTQAARDAWFIGFTADYVAGVWMGYDDNTPLIGVTGGGLPAEIWKETMARVHKNKAPRPLPIDLSNTRLKKQLPSLTDDTKASRNPIEELLMKLMGSN
ncbi:MAG: PBP1A family penicillin-binding protein [Paracoccaceae bacterium]|nr:PBP1A family penicillin-binding protein [Paracoccaceae bacterium]